MLRGSWGHGQAAGDTEALSAVRVADDPLGMAGPPGEVSQHARQARPLRARGRGSQALTFLVTPKSHPSA